MFLTQLILLIWNDFLYIAFVSLWNLEFGKPEYSLASPLIISYTFLNFFVLIMERFKLYQYLGGIGDVAKHLEKS